MNKLEKIIAFSQEKLAHEQTGHDFLHAQRVAHLAKKIIFEEDLQVNQEIVLCSAYLHDVIDDKVVSNVEQAVIEVKQLLETALFTEEEKIEIMHIIQNLSFSKELEVGKSDLSLAGKIVQDADRLEALGAIGILRTAYYGGNFGHPIYDETIQPQKFLTKEEYRKGSTVINHFYEKLFLLPEKMNTIAGKKEAERRKIFMEEFLKEFYAEWQV